MNREEIIRMAREAGMRLNMTEALLPELEHFFQAAYAAGAAAERGACAAVCYRHAAFVVDPIGKERIRQCATAIRARGQT